MPPSELAVEPAPPAGRARSPQQGWCLVLGGGGAPGSAYIAGALSALADAGVPADSADLLIGTSAGALAAAMLRDGRALSDVLAVSEAPPEGGHAERAWSNPHQLARRLVGATAVVSRTLLRVPVPMAGPRTNAAFPPGLFRIRDIARMAALLPEQWPAKALWLVAFDLATRRAEALGRQPEADRPPLLDAVLASCAVPGVYEPVTIGDRSYVDGGVASTTNMSVAVRAGYRKIVCIAPMAYFGRGHMTPGQRLLRAPSVRKLRREMSLAASRGCEVLVLAPTVADLPLHGTNVFRPVGNAAVAESAYDQTRVMIAQPSAARLLDALGRRGS